MMDIAFFDLAKLTKALERSGHGVRKTLTVSGLLSERTISSAFSGEPITRKKALVLVQRLNNGSNESTESLDRLLDENWMALASAVHQHFPKELFSVIRILQDWRTKGHSTGGSTAAANMPLHPEYVYRISGDWTSWNDLFSVPVEETDSRAENDKADFLESIAWGALNQCLSNSNDFVAWWFALNPDADLSSLTRERGITKV